MKIDDLKAVEGLEPVEGAEPAPLPAGIVLRYQSIYMGMGAAGNIRFRIREDGAVFMQRNGLGDFDPPQRWEADYPDVPTATLNEAARKRVSELIEAHDFFSLAPGYTSVRGMDGGNMEILELRLGDREHRVIVDRGEHPGFSAIRDTLLQLIHDSGGN